MTAPALGSKLAQLAEMVVDDALSAGVSLEERLDALKTAGAYHIAATKAHGKPQDDNGGSTFGNYAAKIKEAEEDDET